MARVIYRILYRLAKIKLRSVQGIEYLPKTPPLIVASNHVGFFDGPALSAAFYRQYHQLPNFLTLSVMWLAWGGPFATKYLGMIRLDKDDKAGSLENMVKVLQRGDPTGIFPEGKRNDGTALLRGKTGAVRMALASGAPLIPVGIMNTTGRTFIQAFSSFFKPQQFITIRFGPAVDLREFRGRPIDKSLLEEATRKLMQAIGKVSGKIYPY